MEFKQNIKGTLCSSFGIGKRGIEIHYGVVVPTGSLGNDGDLYVYKSTTPKIYQKVNGEWNNIGTKRIINISSTTDHTNLLPEEVLLVDTTSNAVTVNLTTASLNTGHTVIIKDKVGNSNINNITITTEGTAKIDGSDTFTISGAFSSYMLVTDGTDWYIL